MLIPYAVDVPYDRRPFVNWLILFVIFAIFILQVAAIHYSPSYQEHQLGPFQVKILEHPFYQWFLNGWHIKGILGHMWIHGGWLHLIGNSLFLWLFGNAVCAKIGNLRFILIYFILGFASAAAHIMFCGGAAIGASGAINGVVGMFLVFFPENDISCLWIFWFPFIRPIVKTFSVSSYWMILMWFAFDIWGAVKGTGDIAYAAHVGGFVTGFVIAIVMLKLKWVTMERYEKSLLQLVGLEKTESYFDDDYFDPLKALQPWMGDGIREQANEDNKSIKLDEQPSAQPPSTRAAASPSIVKQDEFIRLICQCGKKVKFPSKYAGKTGRCPACGNRINIIAPEVNVAEPKEKNQKNENFIRFSCKCGKKMKVSQKYSGRIVKCPVCQNKIKIP